MELLDQEDWLPLIALHDSLVCNEEAAVNLSLFIDDFVEVHGYLFCLECGGVKAARFRYSDYYKQVFVDCKQCHWFWGWTDKCRSQPIE